MIIMEDDDDDDDFDIEIHIYIYKMGTVHGVYLKYVGLFYFLPGNFDDVIGNIMSKNEENDHSRPNHGFYISITVSRNNSKT